VLSFDEIFVFVMRLLFDFPQNFAFVFCRSLWMNRGRKRKSVANTRTGYLNGNMNRADRREKKKKDKSDITKGGKDHRFFCC